MFDKLLYIETFGCQMNVNDSERIITMLANLSYAPTNDPASADMILLNTCSVRGRRRKRCINGLQICVSTSGTARNRLLR